VRSGAGAPPTVQLHSRLGDPVVPLQVKALQEAAPSLGIRLLIREIRTADDLPAAFAAGVKDRADGLITTSASIFRVQRSRVTELAARHRLPAMYPLSAMADGSGGLIAYIVVEPDLQRRTATYVDISKCVGRVNCSRVLVG
jgi:putative ABC transport system substrate-binding protein